MRVGFKRTGERRYAVVVEVPGEAAQIMSPAPGFDEHIPHDLVHYVVEATLELEAGVFGRAARGGGTFRAAETATNAREQARKRRRQARREQALRLLAPVFAHFRDRRRAHRAGSLNAR